MSFDCAVLVCLGVPAALERGACADFIRAFLGDADVLNVPWPLRKFLAWRISEKRADAYLQNLRAVSACGVHPAAGFAGSLAAKLSARLGVPVGWGGVCGSPSVSDAVRAMRSQGCSNPAFVILYPQRASSMTFPALRAVRAAGGGATVESYHDNPAYIDAVAASAAAAAARADALLVCFHGVPLSQLKRCDYARFCRETFGLLKSRMPGVRMELAWQSVMDFGRWTSPRAADAARALAESGAERLAVVCPGFFCDCVETTLEIGRDLRDTFLKAGGRSFEFVPCLNDSDAHAELLEGLLKGLH